MMKGIAIIIAVMDSRILSFVNVVISEPALITEGSATPKTMVYETKKKEMQRTDITTIFSRVDILINLVGKLPE